MTATTSAPTALGLPGKRESRFAYLARVSARKRELGLQRELEARQMAAVYPKMRVFDVVEVDPVLPGPDGDAAVASLPRVVTLVTPDHDDHSRDQLYFGPYPVLAKDFRYDAPNERAEFATEDRYGLLRGSLNFEVGRSRAFGIVDHRGQALSVELRVRPQRYLMRLAAGAADWSGPEGYENIDWDVKSTAWQNAKWTDEQQVAFTWGTKEYPSSTPGQPPVLGFYARFDSPVHGTEWEPYYEEYSGYLRPGPSMGDPDELRFVLDPASGMDPDYSGHQWSWFPYQLRAHLDPYADTFVGGMLTRDWSTGDPQVRMFGLKGRWEGGHAAGLYYLYREAGRPESAVTVGVFDGTLYVDDIPVPSSRMAGDTLSWRYLPRRLRGVGLPAEGRLVFSADGDRIVELPDGFAGGDRVAPDSAATVADSAIGTRTLVRTRRAASRASDLSVTELLNMSSMVRDPDNNLKDKFQEAVLSDLHKILLNYMDKDLRQKWLMPTPPTLDPKVREISQIHGVDANGNPINPAQWYYSLTQTFLACNLGETHPHPAANKLNKARAEKALNEAFAESSVAQRQSSALYAHQFRSHYTRIGDYTRDQTVNHANYVDSIRAKIAELVKQVEDYSNTHKDDQINRDKMVTQLKNMGDRVISNRAFWAMAVFSHITSVSMLNRYRTMAASNDTSRIPQEVNSFNALLSVLDETGSMSKEYNMVLAYFHISALVPSLANISDNHALLGNYKLLVQKFIDQYKNGTDTELAEIAQEMQQKLDDNRIAELFDILVHAARVAGTWTHFASVATTKIGQWAGGIFSRIAGSLVVVAAGVLIAQFASGQVNWSSLSPVLQGGVIVLAVRVTAQLLGVVVRFGMSLNQLWNSRHAFWSAVKATVSPTTVLKVTTSSSAAMGSVAGEAVGQVSRHSSFSSSTATAASQTQSASQVAKSKSLLQSIFGKKLGMHLGLGLGTAFALAALGLSIWFAVTSDAEGWEAALNWIFVAAAALEAVAALAAWGFAAAGVTTLTTLGGLAVSTLCTMLSVFAAGLLIVGVIIMIILFSKGQEHPLEQFVRESPFHRPYGYDLDDFEIFTPDDQQSQLVGVSISPQGDRAKCLRMDSNKTISAAPHRRTAHTGFLLRTDGEGRAQFWAMLPDDKCIPHLFGLAVDANGNLVVSQMPEGGSDHAYSDPRAMWRFTPTGAHQFRQGKLDGSDTSTSMLEWGEFTLYNEWWYTERGIKRHLAFRDGRWTVAESSGSVVRVSMEGIGPQCLTMSPITWTTAERGREQYPGLMPGSRPYTFSLSPALPSGLVFDYATGRVSMKPDTSVPVSPKRTHTLTVKEKGTGEGQGSATVDFTVEIVHQAPEGTRHE